MTNRRGFFGMVAGLLAWRPSKPTKPTTGNLFNPHADVFSQFYKGRKKIGDTIYVRRPPRYFASAPPFHPARIDAVSVPINIQPSLALALDEFNAKYLHPLHDNLANRLDSNMAEMFSLAPRCPFVPADSEFLQPSGDIPLAVVGEDDEYDEWD